MKKLLYEPLVHFLLIGAVLFAVYAYVDRGRGGVESSKQIRFTFDDLAQIAGQPEDSKLAASFADPFMFQEYYRDRAPKFLGKEFGPRFALAVPKLPPGSWQGPVESGFGWHLVFVDTLVPGRIPPF